MNEKRFVDRREDGVEDQETSIAAYKRAQKVAREYGLSFHGRTTPEYRAAIAGGWNSLPSAFRAFFEVEKIEPLAGASYGDVSHELGDIYLASDEVLGRWCPDQTFGACSLDDKRIVVPEFKLNKTAAPRWITPLNALSVRMGLWRQKKPALVSKALRHEAWHAIDFFCGSQLFGANAFGEDCVLSRMAAFTSAYEKDIAELGGRKAAIEKGLVYFVGDGLSQADEAFAHLGAEVTEGMEPSGSDLSDFMPRSRKIIERFIQDFQSTFENQGPDLFKGYKFNGYRKMREALDWMRYPCADRPQEALFRPTNQPASVVVPH